MTSMLQKHTDVNLLVITCYAHSDRAVAHEYARDVLICNPLRGGGKTRGTRGVPPTPILVCVCVCLSCRDKWELNFLCRVVVVLNNTSFGWKKL